jgi:hypothetical protein
MVVASTEGETNMTDHRILHLAATRLDAEFQAALVAAYGKARAGDARYYHEADHDDAEVIRLSVAYRKAIDAWQRAYVAAGRP